MAGLMRSRDWSPTSLGAIDTWSQSLKTAVRIMLTSRQPMFVWWGEDLINLYNDAYRAILGGKHPQALAQPAAVVWQEIWDWVGPRAEMALLKNEGTYDEALQLIMERNGYSEETYYTFSYSPIPNDDGSTGGIICANTDDTARIIGERQLALLKELAARTADARTFDDACTLSASCLETNLYDLPFAAIYLVDPEKQQAVLAGTSGIDRGQPVVPETVDLKGDTIWHFRDVLKTNEPYLISDLGSLFPDLPTGAWNRPPDRAVALPIAPSGRTGKAGILFAGINPFRLFDDRYQQFLKLVAAQITASIANAQAYEEERKRAEALAELDRAKTAFFSNISHEFRTPLTLMLGPLDETLDRLDGQVPSAEREQLQMVRRNGQRLLKLVNTLLDFSRIEAGRVQAVYEPTDLTTFTAELASVFRSAIEQAGLQFIVACEPLSAPVYVDREMWEKIVLNLLSNAFKFTFAGKIAIALQQVGNQVNLTVRDTGIGIPAAELPRLFERFHRVEGAQGRTQEGSGIGLALVQELVRLHGGQVRVDSIEGEGTQFTISIPTGTAHLPPDRIQAARTLVSTASDAASYAEEALRWLPDSERTTVNTSLPETENTPSLPHSLTPSLPHSPSPPTARILLVDDNADMREYVKRLLVRQYEVETAIDGRAALEAIDSHLPDLVLTDVMMPHLDGFGLLNALRGDERTREIPIVMLSARAGEEARIEGLEAGADYYLTKPFSARELLARVEANLKLARLRQESGKQEQKLRLEAEIARQEVETILSSINDGFYVLDLDWRYTYVNDRYCAMAGKKRENLLGQNVWDLFAEAVDTDVYVRFHQSMREQTPLQFEHLYSTWNRWYEHRIYPSPKGLTGFVAEITVRKQAEATSQQREAELRLVTNAVPALISFVDTERRYRFNNWRYEEWYGRSANEIYGQHIREVLGETGYQAISCYVDRVLAGEEVTFENQVADKHGKTRYVNVKYVPRFDRQGAVEGFVALIYDISDRKQVEEALRQSETRLRLTLESAKDYAIFTLDLNGIIASWNSGAERLLGYSETEAIGTDGRIIFTPEDRDRGRPDWEMQTALTHGRAENERWHIRQDGSCFWGSGLMRPLLDEAGNPQGYIKILQDRTAQQQASQRLQLLYETTRDLLVSDRPLTMMQALFHRLSAQLDLDYYYNFMVEPKNNRSMLHLSNYEGISEETARALEWVDFGQHLCGLVAQTRQQLVLNQAQLTAHPNAQVLCAMGATAYAGQPLIVGGKLLGTLSFVSRTRAEFTPEEIDLLQSTCDQMAIALERANLTASLQQQAEQLRQANHIKDEFLAVLSHELRSPLNPILGWSKLLQRGKLDAAKTQQAIATIERNAKLQSELIEDLLDVSRILQGKLRLTVNPVRLALVVEAAIETVRLAAEAKSIEIEVNLDAEVGQVLGDPTRLQQVMWNLLSNAVKFTPAGGKVEVQLKQIGDLAQIAVSDTGKGISADFLPYVFDYFRQADSATTRKFGGLGLGLAIVRHLVELHGGTIKADSPGEGLGATFTVKLPLMPTLPATNPTPQSSECPLDLKNIQVLVVDDDRDTREFVTFLLEEFGAEVKAVASAREAISAFTQFRPDVLLSDIGMPDMDGYMLMQHIRALPPERGGQVPAIAFTAYAGDFNQQQALQAGFQRHLTKPIEPQLLIEAIAELRA